ncbi:MAG: hypothetical protein MIN69_13380 [Methylorubrum extorquens]|jgi:hypothetical protein|uniref:P-loop ATPase, Sll1717 family n=1 Tax=Methylorubrum extorquens TaxID=408 RepID=UPI002FEE5181
MPKTGFFAFPNQPSSVGASVRAATDVLKQNFDINVTPWPEMVVQGIQIATLIRERITSADFLAGDITHPNFNVYYEFGYALGQGKPIIPTVNASIDTASRNAKLTGLFDTVGQVLYENSTTLAEQIAAAELRPLREGYLREKDHVKPLFLLDTLAKTDFRNYIIQSISTSEVGSRIFDPDETPRLSVADAVTSISCSAGVIIPLIAEGTVDYLRHNLRAAFLAGVAHGLNIETLIIQFDNEPAPIDFRDEIDTTRGKREVEKSVLEYCQQTLIRNQRSVKPKRSRVGLLEKIDIGTSAAEREAPKLDYYFIRTAEFARALRSDGSIVIGRKGSGKSAIFYQVVADKLEDKRNLIIELSPASHNLSEMRESLLEVMNVGVFDHTIAAFWQYVLYAEVLIKLRELLISKSKYNMKLMSDIEGVEKRFRLTDEMVSADFTSRLDIAVKSVVSMLGDVRAGEDIRPKLTNVLFDREMPALRDAIGNLSVDYDNIVILFDNIDKGWPAKRVEEHDVRMVRHLVDVLNKMQRELRRKEIVLNYLLFLRSDVYEKLVEETSDRGKYNVIKIDWSDEAQLIRLMRERVTSAFDGPDAEEAWKLVNPQMQDGRSAIQWLVESSLMRPRFLIDLSERAISFAINRGHSAVEEEDVEAAVEQHATYLVSDFGFEVRDVSGISEQVFYSFLGADKFLTSGQVAEIIDTIRGDIPNGEVLSLLLWYGFLGINTDPGGAVYIYNRAYDIRRLEAERDKIGSNVRYVVNPAFLHGL